MFPFPFITTCKKTMNMCSKHSSLNVILTEIPSDEQISSLTCLHEKFVFPSVGSQQSHLAHIYIYISLTHCQLPKPKSHNLCLRGLCLDSPELFGEVCFLVYQFNSIPFYSVQLNSSQFSSLPFKEPIHNKVISGLVTGAETAERQKLKK